MKKNILLGLIFLLCGSFKVNHTQTLYPYSQFEDISFEEIKIKDSFWLPLIQQTQTVTLPSLFEIAEKQGKIDNFRIVAGLKKGKIKLYNAPDSDVYKLIEAAGYTLSQNPNIAFQKQIDDYIDIIAKAQSADGYLNTQYALPFSDEASPNPETKHVKTFGYGIDSQWKSEYTKWPFGYSQLYCAGHLMEAAVVYFKATSNRKLLDVAIRLADNIVKNFNQVKIENYGEHPQVEIGLMKLYDITQNADYLKYANLFSRYVKFTRPVDIDKQNKQPLHLQRLAFGHCVRTAYIYTGATHVVRATGSKDLQEALNSIWKNILASKMYIHGGTGNGTQAEQHGKDYELPILDTYSECCAAIAESQWNHAFNLLSGEAKYADLVEIETYNNALASMSADGKAFFYSNKLNIDSTNRKNRHTGVRESYLFCCPSKVPTFVAGISRWTYAKQQNNLIINQFVGSEVGTNINQKLVKFKTITQYPYQGKLKIEIIDNQNTDLGVWIRLPSWLKSQTHLSESPYFFEKKNTANYQIKLNGKSIKARENTHGYIQVQSPLKTGDVIDFEMEMPTQFVRTNEKVKANQGRVALLRGPLLYALEGIDNDFDVLNFQISLKSKIQTSSEKLLNQEIVVLKGKGVIDRKSVNFKAIPYFLWQNRGIHPFSTLLIYDPKKINIERAKTEKMNTNG